MPGGMPMDFGSMFAMGQSGMPPGGGRAPVQTNTPAALPPQQGNMVDIGGPEGGPVSVKPNAGPTTAAAGTGGMNDMWSQWMSDPNNVMGLVMLFGGLMGNLFNQSGRR